MAEEFLHKFTISGPELSLTVAFEVGTFTINRQQSSDIHLNHPRVSRRHAELRCTATLCEIVDVGSANGTYVNDVRLLAQAPVTLKEGDSIQITPFQLVYGRELIVRQPPAVQEIAEIVDETGPAIAPRKATAVATPPPPPIAKTEIDYSKLPPGLSYDNSNYVQYLPGIYETDFIKRFLALVESILAPIEWNVDNFDLYLSPGTAPPGFLPWLANWFNITFDASWSEAQRRTLLMEAHQIYAGLGTKRAMSRLLEIYVGRAPNIDDKSDDLEPFTFNINIPVRQDEVNSDLVQKLIDATKPAHTLYKLRFKK